MGRIRGGAVGVMLFALVLVAGACGDSGEDTEAGGEEKGNLTVGSFNFGESEILANMYAAVLEEEGFQVAVRDKLGTREVVQPALQRGELDLVPEYVGTVLEFLNKNAGEASSDLDASVAKLRERLRDRGLSALEPSSAENRNSFAVTRATAERYDLEKTSDLGPLAAQFTLGGPPECPVRPFCQPGLENTYGLRFQAFKPLDAGGPLTKAALDNGDVDVALLFSSDGAVEAQGFVVLDDDKGLQTVDNVVPVIRTDKLTDEVEQALNRLSAELTTEDLIELNKRVDVDKEDPSDVARDWLADNDLAGGSRG